MAKSRRYYSQAQSGYSKREWRQKRERMMIMAGAVVVIIGWLIYTLSPVLKAAGQAAMPSFVSFVSVVLTIIQYGFWAAVVVLFLCGVAKAYSVHSESKLKWAQPNDAGFFPLQTIDANGGGMAGFFGGLMGNSFKMVVDINKLPTGVIHPMIETPRIDGDQQLAFATTVEKAKTFTTIAKNNMRAATARAALTNMDRHHLPKQSWKVTDEQPALPVMQPEVKLINAQEAFNQSTTDEWIVGQDRVTGDLCKINVKDLTYFGVLGEKGTGKTARMGNLLMAYAIRYGWHCMTLDGKGGSDLQAFDKYAEFVALDYTNIGSVVDVLSNERDRRQHILNQYRVNNIFLLPDEAKVQPIFVLCDEFGAVMDTLKAYNNSEHKKVDAELGNLFRLGRSTGIVMAVCDQNPSKWSNTMRANFSINILFKLGGGVGAAVQAYNLHKLKKDGGFDFEGHIYHAFNTWEHITTLLPNRYRKPQPLLNGNSISEERTNHTSTKTVSVSEQTDTPLKKRTSTDGTDGTTGTNDSVMVKVFSGPVTSRRELLVFQKALDHFGTQNSVIKHLWGVETITPKHRKWYKAAMQKLEAQQ